MDGSEEVVSANLTSELAASSQNSLPGQQCEPAQFFLELFARL